MLPRTQQITTFPVSVMTAKKAPSRTRGIQGLRERGTVITAPFPTITTATGLLRTAARTSRVRALPSGRLMGRGPAQEETPSQAAQEAKEQICRTGRRSGLLQSFHTGHEQKNGRGREEIGRASCRERV